jgi:hypothetical protein
VAVDDTIEVIDASGGERAELLREHERLAVERSRQTGGISAVSGFTAGTAAHVRDVHVREGVVLGSTLAETVPVERPRLRRRVVRTIRAVTELGRR